MLIDILESWNNEKIFIWVGAGNFQCDMTNLNPYFTYINLERCSSSGKISVRPNFPQPYAYMVSSLLFFSKITFMQIMKL